MLDKIIAYKKDEVSARKQKRKSFDLTNCLPTRPFYQSLLDTSPSVIAEVKKASPSKGVIATHFDPVQTAIAYEQAGAACLSVLTDEHFFQGHDDYLVKSREAIKLPVLRKDFIIDEYQLYESRSLGADAVLLIVAALSKQALKDYYECAIELGLAVLIECHNAMELEQAISLNPKVIGINNRDLKTFKTDLNTTVSLLPLIPKHIQVVTESGIHSSEDIKFFLKHGVSSFLIGEFFMRNPSPGKELSSLLKNSV